MDTTIFYQFSAIPTREMTPGFFSKIIHTDNNTINFLEIKAGHSSARHQHVHEQCIFVIEGKFELTVNDVPQVMDPGIFAIIPSNIFHSAVALTDCKVIDIFSPVREDFK
jgi:quercetin dioxygenase-like cupin family protein